ncbi:MAG: DinB family protein [Dokdonia sp.]|jgi:hypothetical protein|nr:hypothetical protein [Cytophagaceae bacterium]
MTYAFDICLKNRQLLEKLINNHTVAQLNKVPEGFNNNIIWNIGHSIVTQQLLVYGLSDQTITLDPDLIAAYRKGSKPQEAISLEAIDHLKALLYSTLEQLVQDYKNDTFATFKSYTLGTTGGVLDTVEQAIEFNNFHEGLHLGYSMALSRIVRT